MLISAYGFPPRDTTDFRAVRAFFSMRLLNTVSDAVAAAGRQPPVISLILVSACMLVEVISASLPRPWRRLRRAAGVLLNSPPPDVDLVTLREIIRGIDGVQEVHDLRVWALTSELNAMSVHLVCREGVSREALRRIVYDRIRSTTLIANMTIWMESESGT